MSTEQTAKPRIRRPKVVPELAASKGFASLLEVKEGETVIVAGRTLSPGSHVIAVAELGDEAEIAAFGFRVLNMGAKLRTTRFQHYTKTGGMEDDAPISVTLSGYVTPVGPEKDVLTARRQAAAAARLEREAKGEKPTGRTRKASGAVIEPEWEPIEV